MNIIPAVKILARGAQPGTESHARPLKKSKKPNDLAGQYGKLGVFVISNDRWGSIKRVVGESPVRSNGKASCGRGSGSKDSPVSKTTPKLDTARVDRDACKLLTRVHLDPDWAQAGLQTAAGSAIEEVEDALAVHVTSLMSDDGTVYSTKPADHRPCLFDDNSGRVCVRLGEDATVPSPSSFIPVRAGLEKPKDETIPHQKLEHLARVSTGKRSVSASVLPESLRPVPTRVQGDLRMDLESVAGWSVSMDKSTAPRQVYKSQRWDRGVGENHFDMRDTVDIKPSSCNSCPSTVNAELGRVSTFWEPGSIGGSKMTSFGCTYPKEDVVKGKLSCPSGAQGTLIDTVGTRVLATEGLNSQIKQRILSDVEKGFVQRINLMVESGRPMDEVRVRLFPPELGEVNIRISMKGRKVKAFFVVESASVKGAIDGGMGRLSEAISQRGFVLEHLDVSIGNTGKQADWDGMDEEIKFSVRPPALRTGGGSASRLATTGDGINFLA